MSKDRVKLLKKRFQMELQELQDQNLNNARRVWSMMKQRHLQTNQIIDAKFENLQARIQNIGSKVKLQNAQLKDSNKKMKTKSDTLKNEILKIREKLKMRSDPSKEIALEVSLKMRKEELENRLKQLDNDISSEQQRADYYQGIMIEMQRKIARRKKNEKDKQRLEKMEKERMESFDILVRKIGVEQDKLKQDLEMLDKYRNEMLSLNAPKRSRKRHLNKQRYMQDSFQSMERENVVKNDPQEAYRRVLLNANLILPEENIPIMGLNDDEKEDFTLPFGDYDEEEDYDALEGPEAAQINALQQNIMTLLGTGMYTEDDDVIIDMKRQLEELRASQGN